MRHKGEIKRDRKIDLERRNSQSRFQSNHILHTANICKCSTNTKQNIDTTETVEEKKKEKQGRTEKEEAGRRTAATNLISMGRTKVTKYFEAGSNR